MIDVGCRAECKEHLNSRVCRQPAEQSATPIFLGDTLLTLLGSIRCPCKDFYARLSLREPHKNPSQLQVQRDAVCFSVAMGACEKVWPPPHATLRKTLLPHF